MSIFYAGELNPVAAKAQKKVPVPEGLDLEAWINEPPSESENEADGDDDDESDEDDDGAEGYNELVAPSPSSPLGKKKKAKKQKEKKRKKKKSREEEEHDVEQARQNRLLEQSMNPNYLKVSLTFHPKCACAKLGGLRSDHFALGLCTYFFIFLTDSDADR